MTSTKAALLLGLMLLTFSGAIIYKTVKNIESIEVQAKKINKLSKKRLQR